MKLVRLLLVMGRALARCAELWGCGGDSSCPALSAPAKILPITSLSKRVDLVSGGDALPEIKLPASLSIASLKVERDGIDVPASFQAAEMVASSACGRIIQIGTARI